MPHFEPSRSGKFRICCSIKRKNRWLRAPATNDPGETSERGSDGSTFVFWPTSRRDRMLRVPATKKIKIYELLAQRPTGCSLHSAFYINATSTPELINWTSTHGRALDNFGRHTRACHCAANLSRASSTSVIDGDGLTMEDNGFGFSDWNDSNLEVAGHSMEGKLMVDASTQGMRSK